MTTDIATPRAQYALSGAGPYALDWPYQTGEIVVQATVDGVTTALVEGTDFTLTPSAAASGNLFLSGDWGAVTGSLYIERATKLEQGWSGTFPGEKGIEAALDRLTRQQQEGVPRARGALWVDSDLPLPPLTPAESRSIIWQGGRFAMGPAVADLEVLADLAGQTEAAAERAEQAAASVDTDQIESAKNQAVFSAGVLTDRRRAFAVLPRPPAVAQVNHVLQIGQSLAIGSNGTPIIHGIALPAPMYTFAGGPKAIPVAAGGVAADTATLKPLVEDTASPDGGAGRGETGLWVAAYTLALALAQERGNVTALGDFVFSAPGIGGQSITFFAKSASPTSWWQQRFRGHILAAQAVAQAQGKTYAVPVIFWAQGEANSGITSTPASYATALRTLFNDMGDEIVAITGQTERPHFVTYQTSYATREGDALTTNRSGTLGQLQVFAGALDVHQASPVYALPHATDGIHLTAEGYAMLGRTFGEALADIMVRNRYPRQIWPVSAVVSEGCREVRVAFRAPEAGVALDSVALPATPNGGFAVRDAAGNPVAISSVTASGNEVIIGLADFLPSIGTVRYAVDNRAVAGADPVGPTIATGNLRAGAYNLPVDGSAKAAGLWCPAFIRDLLPPPSGRVWPGFEAVGAGGGHWLFDKSAGQLTDRVNARAITDNGGLSAGVSGLAVSGVFGQGGTTNIADTAQLTICAVVRTTNDWATIAGALTATTGSALLLTQNGASSFTRSSGGSRTATAIHGTGSGTWRFLASVEDYAAAQARGRTGAIVNSVSLSGLTKATNGANTIGLGSRYWSNATYNKGFEIAELIIIPSALTTEQMAAIYARSVARMTVALGLAVA